jgi:hypothetical protein
MLVTQGTRPEQPSSDLGRVMPDDLWSIVESCWVQQPSKQLHMSEVVRMLQKGHRQSPVPSHSADSMSSRDDTVTTDTDNQELLTGSLPQQNSTFQNLLSHVHVPLSLYSSLRRRMSISQTIAFHRLDPRMSRIFLLAVPPMNKRKKPWISLSTSSNISSCIIRVVPSCLRQS